MPQFSELVGKYFKFRARLGGNGRTAAGDRVISRNFQFGLGFRQLRPFDDNFVAAALSGREGACFPRNRIVRFVYRSAVGIDDLYAFRERDRNFPLVLVQAYIEKSPAAVASMLAVSCVFV